MPILEFVNDLAWAMTKIMPSPSQRRIAKLHAVAPEFPR